MATYSEQLQALWHRYERECRRQASTPREAVDWLVARGLLAPKKVDPRAKLAEEMARALREEVRVDSAGREYRVNHAIRVTSGGVQTTFWANIETASPEHMKEAFAQRRKQIVGDCLQLKTDVDVYNDLHPNHQPIQMLLDFTDDVAERQTMTGTPGKAA